MECLVEHEYTAQEEDELSLAVGDIIKNVVTKMDGWWEGTLNGKKGMFPDNFVKVQTTNSGAADDVFAKSGDVAQMRKKSESGSHPRRLRAVFSYAPEQDDELGLEVGDIVNFLAEVEEGWWRGELKDRTGIFPSNFVEEVAAPAPETNGSGEHQRTDQVQKQKDSNRTTFLVKGQGIPDVVPAARTPVSDEEPAPKLPPKPVRETARCFYPYFAQNEDELTLQEGDIVNIISKECEDEGWWRGEVRGKSGMFPDNFVKIISPNDPVNTSPAVSSANQPKVTAQERTAGNVSRNDSIIRKEKGSPSPSYINSGTIPSGTSVVDGVGGSKIEPKNTSPVPVKETPSSGSGFLGKASIFKSNKVTKKDSFEKKLAPQIGLSAKIKQEPAPAPVSVFKPSSPGPDSLQNQNGTEAEDFNAIERGEKLSHLTATRAKAPRRRPPSAIISPRDDEPETGITNGSISMHATSDPASADEPQAPRPPASHKSPVVHTFSVPEAGRSSPIKELSPGPTSSVNKPKQSLPWMAELKQKQDRKSIISVNSSNNVSSVTVSTSGGGSLKGPSPTPPPISTRAPPLPAKPHLPSPTVTEKPIVSLTNSHHATNHTTTVVASSGSAITTTNTSSVMSTASSKFGQLKRMGSSTPSPPATTLPPVNHHNANSNATDHPAVPDFVSYEEHRKLKERVATLETELETLRQQMKLVLDREFGKGQIV